MSHAGKVHGGGLWGGREGERSQALQSHKIPRDLDRTGAGVKERCHFQLPPLSGHSLAEWCSSSSPRIEPDLSCSPSPSHRWNQGFSHAGEEKKCLTVSCKLQNPGCGSAEPLAFNFNLYMPDMGGRPLVAKPRPWQCWVFNFAKAMLAGTSQSSTQAAASGPEAMQPGSAEPGHILQALNLSLN